MGFGQFNLMGYRTQGTPAERLYDDAVEQVKAAERAGFATAWFAEHHFSNYCVCPSRLMMIARLAGETRRIKLGSGVVVVPLYHPVRLISELGMVDALQRLAAAKNYAVMVTPRHFTAEMLAKARARYEEICRHAGSDLARLRFAVLRHLWSPMTEP